MLNSEIKCAWYLVILDSQSSFSHLGNSGNSAIFGNGKSLTNVKIYFERKVFKKIKFNYKAMKFLDLGLVRTRRR